MTTLKSFTHSCLMTFEPLPREYFSRDDASSSRLMSRIEKIRTLGDFEDSLRPDYLLFLKFDRSLAAMSAVEFIEQVLIETLKIRAVIVGDDFRFGCDRKGDFDLLSDYGDKYGFSVSSIESHCIDDHRVSSSLIRDALINDQLERTDRMLGRRYTICGHVNHGDKRGRTIGFPTLNLVLRRRSSPLRGVYAVRVAGLGESLLPGVANIGIRPTVEGDDRFMLEVHLFDFDREVYGQLVEVDFVTRIRDEMKFDSFDALRRQILEDADKARRLLGVKQEQQP